MFVAANRDAASVLQAIKASFYAIAQRVNGAVDLDLRAPVLLGRNNWHSAMLFQVGTNGIGIATAVDHRRRLPASAHHNL